MLNSSIFLLLALLLCETSKAELLSVIVIFRHGERTLLFPYPNDPYNQEKYWPEGLCQLTKSGKQQCFELGLWLRKRYSDFLPSVYNMKDIHFRSTNRDRTLMSGSYLAGGLYHIRGRPWTVVPIHTKPVEDDNMLLMRSPCPRCDYLKQKLYRTSPFKELHSNYSKLFQFLSHHSGMKIKDIDGINKLYDTLEIEKGRNLTLPKWTSNVFPEPLRSLGETSITAETYSKELGRLKPGLLLNWIIKHFDGVLQEHPFEFFLDTKPTDYHGQKFVVFCAHDHVIVNLLQVFGIFDMRWPRVASALIFEYHESVSGDKYMNLFYKNSPNEPIKLCVKNCSHDCQFKDFKQVVLPYVIDEKTWAEECKMD